MELTRARKQGNSVMITLNKQLGVKEGSEFYIFKDEHCVIQLIPKLEDIYANVQPGDFVDEELDQLAQNYTPEGAELDD